jgi:hypothetical protein
MLLVVMHAAWAFALALLRGIAGIGILAGAFDAAFYDTEERATGRAVSPRALCPRRILGTRRSCRLQRRGAPRPSRQAGRRSRSARERKAGASWPE